MVSAALRIIISIFTTKKVAIIKMVMEEAQHKSTTRCKIMVRIFTGVGTKEGHRGQSPPPFPSPSLSPDYKLI